MPGLSRRRAAAHAGADVRVRPLGVEPDPRRTAPAVPRRGEGPVLRRIRRMVDVKPNPAELGSPDATARSQGGSGGKLADEEGEPQTRAAASYPPGCGPRASGQPRGTRRAYREMLITTSGLARGDQRHEGRRGPEGQCWLSARSAPLRSHPIARGHVQSSSTWPMLPVSPMTEETLMIRPGTALPHVIEGGLGGEEGAGATGHQGDPVSDHAVVAVVGCARLRVVLCPGADVMACSLLRPPAAGPTRPTGQPGW